MFTTVMKWISVGALLLAMLWRPGADFQLLLEVVVCVSGLLVLAQAARTGRYLWAAGFLTIAVLFNPFLPVVFSRQITIGLGFLSLAAFLISLVALKWQPTLSMPSITDRTPGSESL